MEVTANCYTRLEQRIRSTYRKIGEFGSSVLGGIAHVCLAEYAGYLAGQYLAGKATSYVEDLTSNHPYVTRGVVLATTGAVVLYGAARTKRFQHLIQKKPVEASIVGILYLDMVWNFSQLFPYILYVNQVAGRILGGYLALVVTGIVPVFYETARWRSCYVVRAVRVEIVNATMTPYTVAHVGMQFFAYHVDWLIPFGLECKRKMDLADKQIIPLLITDFVVNLAASQKGRNRKVIEGMTNTFSNGLKQCLVMLFPPIYLLTFIDKATLSNATQTKIGKRVKASIQQGVNKGISGGEHLVKTHGELFVRWGLRTFVAFGNLLEDPKIKQAHAKWKKAFLDCRFNDRGLEQQELAKEMDYVLGRRYPRSYRRIHAMIENICLQQNLARNIKEKMDDIPLLEKQLLGFSLSKPIHKEYWGGLCDVYLSRFLTLAFLRFRKLSAEKMMPLEDKKLMQSMESFVCHAYLDVVFSKQSHPWIRESMQTLASKIYVFKEKVLHCVCEAEDPQAWVDLENDVDRRTITEEDAFYLVEADPDYDLADMSEEMGS